MTGSTLEKVRAAARKGILFRNHAVVRMTQPDRLITQDEVIEAIRSGEVIEDYPNDPRGHSCLILGHGGEGRSIHIVCAPKAEYLTIITAYLPDADRWSHDLRVRNN